MKPGSNISGREAIRMAATRDPTIQVLERSPVAVPRSTWPTPTPITTSCRTTRRSRTASISPSSGSASVTCRKAIAPTRTSTARSLSRRSPRLPGGPRVPVRRDRRHPSRERQPGGRRSLYSGRLESRAECRPSSRSAL